MKRILLILSFMAFSVQADKKIVAPWVGNTLKGTPCQSDLHGFGPYDYRKRQFLEKQLDLVEGAHFQPDIENLIEGHHRSGTSPMPDLDYTLRAFPNHQRALLTMIRFQLQVNKKITKHKAPIPAECYLQRAIHFSPDDPVPYSLYGYYLTKVDQDNNAEKFYKKALELSPDNSKIEYSYALLLIDLKRTSEAVEMAKKAYLHGRPPEGLKNKLKKIGAWEK